MSTWYGYVCLSHEPAVEGGRDYHGNAGYQLLCNLLDARAGNKDDIAWHRQRESAEAFLEAHPDCKIGVKDGYGQLETKWAAPKLSDQPEISLQLDADESEVARAMLWAVAADAENWSTNARKVARKMAEAPELPKPYMATEQTAQGGPVAKASSVWSPDAGEELIPLTELDDARIGRRPKGEPHAVRQNDLVDALKHVAGKFPVHSEIHHALRLLANELIKPAEKAASVEPKTVGQGIKEAAASVPVPGNPRPMEIAWPGDLDPDDRAGIAQQLESIGHSSGLTYWLDVAKAIRSIRAPR